jgi:hypothetical protein
VDKSLYTLFFDEVILRSFDVKTLKRINALLRNKIVGMAESACQTFVMAILKVFTLEVEFPTESTFCQRGKEFV